jgi:hypothetical protein
MNNSVSKGATKKKNINYAKIDKRISIDSESPISIEPIIFKTLFQMKKSTRVIIPIG